MNEFDDMFAGGGNFAPTFKFAQIGDTVSGEILSTEQQDQRDINDPTGQTYVMDPKTGKPKKQLKVVLQTALRNWAQVSKVPVDMETKQPLPASEDDGRRAVYVKGWMIGAVGEAVQKATGQRGAPRVGGKLAVRFSATRDTGKPQPMKVYDAQYQAPATVAGDSMFSEAPQQAPAAPQGFAQQPGGAPVQQQPAAQQAAPQADPWATGAHTGQQAAPAQQAAPQADPWATGGGFPDQPSF